MRTRTTTTTMTTTISHLWDLIESWGFHEELKALVLHHPCDDNNKKEDKDEEEDKDKEEEEEDNNNNDDNFSVLGLDRHMVFSPGSQGNSSPSP